MPISPGRSETSAARKRPAPRLGIDRTSPVPLHVQARQVLLQEIQRGAWKPGDRVPGEPDLCRRFGVSRTTVRQALAELKHLGLVVREQGRGTFVAPPKLTESAAQRLSGFYEDMVALGHRPVSRVLKQAVVPADEHVAERLKLRAGERVVEIERLRFVQDEPVVLTTTYLPHALCPGLKDADLTRRSLYEYLETECGLSLVRGRRTIEAVAASSRQAGLLRIRKGAPLILMESVSYLADQRPIEYYVALHRADRSRFEVELLRRRGPVRAGSGRVARLPPGGGDLKLGGTR
jgi:GntR family transcriptional regulator